jgi:N-ethylmaleimide reductase
MSKLHAQEILTPYKLGDLDLPNRIVMAPLTRNRAAEGGVPTPLMAEYYAQRSSAGLIISEASQISAQGQGYAGTPGIYTDAQLAGWNLVTHAVHTCGGRIFLQLWHVGRISHTSLQPGGEHPVAPSAIRAKAQTFVGGSFTDVSEPRALNVAEIREIVGTFATAAKAALSAGFDGVEIHAANGYLIDQFLCDGSNKRTDEYGGSVENRTRFLLEVTQAVIKEVGEDCVGVRISPVSTANDVHDSDAKALFNHVVERLDHLRPVYLHVIEGQTGGPRDFDPTFDFIALRKKFHRTYMANNGYTSLRSPTRALKMARWTWSPSEGSSFQIRIWLSASERMALSVSWNPQHSTEAGLRGIQTTQLVKRPCVLCRPPDNAFADVRP